MACIMCVYRSGICVLENYNLTLYISEAVCNTANNVQRNWIKVCLLTRLTPYRCHPLIPCVKSTRQASSQNVCWTRHRTRLLFSYYITPIERKQLKKNAVHSWSIALVVQRDPLSWVRALNWKRWSPTALKNHIIQINRTKRYYPSCFASKSISIYLLLSSEIHIFHTIEFVKAQLKNFGVPLSPEVKVIFIDNWIFCFDVTGPVQYRSFELSVTPVVEPSALIVTLVGGSSAVFSICAMALKISWWLCTRLNRDCFISSSRSLYPNRLWNSALHSRIRPSRAAIPNAVGHCSKTLR